jgi:hypothetical protein
MKYTQVKKAVGGPTKIAAALGIKNRQTVAYWKNSRIPTLWQLKLEAITGLKADEQSRKEASQYAQLLRPKPAAGRKENEAVA